jgi:bla regulator protein BlaR1
MMMQTSWAAALANHLWQSTALVLAAWALTFSLRKNQARVRYCVWLIASLKFLVPFSPLIEWGRHIGQSAAAPIVHTALSRNAVSIMMGQIAQPFPQGQRLPATPVAVHDLRWITVMLLTLWAIGALFLVLKWANGWLRLRSAVQSARPLALQVEIPAISSNSLMEPGVFGILRPVLIMPNGILDRLSKAQLRAVVAHEICHVRRRDNLTFALHMVVETLFWFHPLVWWIRASLIKERERACDEAVLLAGSAADVYAEGILSVCRFYVESPLPCASGVTGSDLKNRIVRIMNEHIGQQLGWPRRLLLSFTAVTVVLVPIVFGLLQLPHAHVQAGTNPTDQPPAFEVASVKPSAPGATMVMTKFTPDGIEIMNEPLIMLIRQAAGFLNSNDDEVMGAPSWVKAERYDVRAKVSEADVPKLEKLSRSERNEMMMSVLKDRFRFAFHRETRELPVFDLVVAKGGVRLKEAVPGNTYENGLKDNQGKSSSGMMRVSYGQVDCQAIPITGLVEILSQLTGRTVVDKTGLAGKYDVALRWTPEDSHAAPTAAENATGERMQESGLSIFTAIQEQLGLKLISAKGPVETLVIDHIEKPDAN